ncbi:hypothetical protein PHYSODRAFT_336458 [Phytophthora sojae]|uniref:Reverse transcriptase RNase H-like domain-containing protein n=1 Tax=Phytophthora sojae (strain P6497) TaxID=1094619 RepID=G4ZYC5_PHYSP|nr:hypothetical protein PHYSODRAFT_336458 [Phytophthora sojae]EGZ11977.1 hypothetical protein PHYSODRAFT_336458 [Phytophthora sojae]|eukprot:XP_009532310.1 hypothetical protein PHYSODRAFT_336458 [Phytophthora sojae]
MLNTALECCKEFGLKLHAKKYQFFSKDMTWSLPVLGELDAPEHSQFTRIAAKLYDTLERAAQRAGSRKKLKPSRVVPLAHPKTRAVLVLYTDASQDHWGAILTQLEPGGLALPLGEQKHRPLAFLSCRFAGIPSLWPMIKKEAFAIVKSLGVLAHHYKSLYVPRDWL